MFQVIKKQTDHSNLNTKFTTMLCYDSESIVKIMEKYPWVIHFVITLEVAGLQLYQKQTLEDVSEESHSQNLCMILPVLNGSCFSLTRGFTTNIVHFLQINRVFSDFTITRWNVLDRVGHIKIFRCFLFIIRHGKWEWWASHVFKFRVWLFCSLKMKKFIEAFLRI